MYNFMFLNPNNHINEFIILYIYVCKDFHFWSFLHKRIKLCRRQQFQEFFDRFHFLKTVWFHRFLKILYVQRFRFSISCVKLPSIRQFHEFFERFHLLKSMWFHRIFLFKNIDIFNVGDHCIRIKLCHHIIFNWTIISRVFQRFHLLKSLMWFHGIFFRFIYDLVLAHFWRVRDSPWAPFLAWLDRSRGPGNLPLISYFLRIWKETNLQMTRHCRCCDVWRWRRVGFRSSRKPTGTLQKF